MKVIEIERHDRDFFCPVTGGPVYDENGSSTTPAYRGAWFNEVPELPNITDPELQRLWTAYLDSVDQEQDFLEIAEFLGSVEHPGWVAFQITTSGFACGPVSETVWTVLDLQHEAE